jgi:hypothetical protein
MKTVSIIAPILCYVGIAGCQNSGSATPTTQAVMVQTTTTAEQAFDLAVNSIHAAITLGVISGPTYWTKIDPSVEAGQQAVASLRIASQAGDVSGAQAATDALNAATDGIKAYLTAETPTTKG